MQARAFIDAGARLLGAWVQQEDEDGLPSYYYEGSKAAWEGPPLFGKFVGLALDDVSFIMAPSMHLQTGVSSRLRPSNDSEHASSDGSF